jgi:hypothetical protein
MLVKSKYTFETMDNNGNILLCNLLYNKRAIICNNDSLTIHDYKWR